MRPAFPLAVLLCALPLAGAEEKAADFSEGLKQLAALGLPDLKDARWVKAPKETTTQNFPDSYQFKELKVHLHGSAWKLPGEPARIIGFGTPVEIASGSAPPKPEEPAKDETAEPSLFEKMLRKHASENPGKKEEAPPKKPGLEAEADAQLIIDALAKPAIKTELAQQLGYGRSELPGRCLIFAAQLHAAGRTDSANKLAAALFAIGPDKALIIDAAISHFAGTEYQAATSAFFKTHDWAAYHASVKAILAKYPRGWADAGGVAMLMGPLEKRVQGTPPPPPSLPGITLKPEAVAALDALLKPHDLGGLSDEELARAAGFDLSQIPVEHRARYIAMLRENGVGNSRGGGQQLWLLVPQPPGKDPAGIIKSLRMDGMVALAAVVTDETLLPSRSATGGGSRYSSGLSPEEAAQETYHRMMRPGSRGEFAAALLREVVPGIGDDADDTDLETLRSAAIDFWTQHRGKSPVELAAVYLASGNFMQKFGAAQFLAEHPDPAAHAVFESSVLASEDPASMHGLVEIYVERRRTAAKAFFDAYAKALRANIGNSSDDDPFSSRNGSLDDEKGVEKFLKKLSVKVGGVTLKEMVDDALKAPPAAAAENNGEDEDDEEDESPIAALATTVDQTPMAECVKILGEAIPKVQPAQAMEILGLLYSTVYSDPRSKQYQKDGKWPKLEFGPDLLAIWKPLLERVDPVPKEGEFSGWARGYGAKNLGDCAALVIELAAFPESGYQYEIYGKVGMPESLMPFVRKRVEAWTGGTEAPAWPDPEKLGEARTKDIESKLSTLPAKEIVAYVKTLDAMERLFVTKLVGSYGQEKTPPDGLVELRDTVVELRPYDPELPHDAPLLQKLGIAEGWRINPTNVEDLAKRLLADAKNLSGAGISFYEAPMQIGSLATATKSLDPASPTYGDFHWNRLAAWFEHHGNPDAMAIFSTEGGLDFWVMKDGSPVKLDPAGAYESSAEKFKQVRETNHIEIPYIQVIVLTREDARKILNE